MNDLKLNADDSRGGIIQRFPVIPRMGEAWKVRIGMVDLASGLTGEEEMHAILPNDALLLTSRVLNSNQISMDALADMQRDMVRAAGTIVPDEHVDVMIYCCTSGTIAMGEDAVRDSLRSLRPKVKISNPFSAAVAAFNFLGIENVSLLTPYTFEVTAAMRQAFVEKGLNIVHSTAYDLKLDSEICQVAQDDIFRSAIEQNISGVDALFISCTGLRVVGLIEKIEAHIGIPVVTSNQAMAWHALSQANYPASVPGFGELMDSLPVKQSR